jgi:hypothetical protein
MEYVDDRTPREKFTHNTIVLGTDSFMSGWGKAEGGLSYAGWACKDEHINQVERWVRKRGDMKRIRIVSGNYRPTGKSGHCHIYAVNEGHSSLK